MKVLRCETWLLCFILLFSVFQCQELDEGEGGDFLFLSDNDEVAEESRSSGKDKARPTCDDSTLASYLTSLQVINPESVIALATKNKLEKKCHNISKTVEKMASYLKTCNLEPEQEIFIGLLNAVKALHKKLCTKNPYNKSFMEHKKCYGQLQAEVADSCNGPADWSDSSEGKLICRAYEEIRDCYYIKASVMCGNKAADIFKEIVQCIIESVITVNCTVLAAEEGSPRMSKEQRLMLQRQRLGQTQTSSQDESGSSRTLYVSRLYQLLTVFTTIYCMVSRVLQRTGWEQIDDSVME